MIIKILSVISIFFLLNITAIAQTTEIIFEAKFDNSLNSVEDESPFLSSGVSFEQGISGSAIIMDDGDVLQYAIPNNLNPTKGSISLWLRPNWDPGDLLYRIFVLGDNPRNFEMHVDEGKLLAYSVNTSQVDNKPIKVAFGSADNWKKGNWYFLTYTWDSENIVIYVNGEEAGRSEVGFDIPLVSDPSFHVGSFNGEAAFMGAIDELRIFDGPLSSGEVKSSYEIYLENLPLANEISITDIFGRNVTADGITLVDWEGPVRNPALKYFIKGSEKLQYPLVVNLSSKEELASFSLPSTISKNGPSKAVEISSEAEFADFLFSVYMDENYANESFDLVLQYPFEGISVKQIIPVNVIDQDKDYPLSYPVIVDFSEARDPLLLDSQSQDVIRQAAEDWLYYIDGEGIDSIPAGESFLDIGGNDHLFEEKRAVNPVPYKGYYLFAYGSTWDGEGVEGCPCSTGFPNRELLQTKSGELVPIFRIGGLHLNIFGQSNMDGWAVSSPFDNWTLEGLANNDEIKADMYFLAKHEIGHAMVFENSPLYLEAQQRLGFKSPALTAYYHDTIVPLLPEALSHLFGILDPASQTPPYGGGVDNEVMPGGREMLTKLDILIMESVGYPLRENEVTRALTLTHETALDGIVNEAFDGQFSAKGGIPIYHFEITSGELPPGLILDETTGIINGIPEITGLFPISFLVKDYEEGTEGKTLETVITIIGAGSSLAELISFNIPNQIGETIVDEISKTAMILMPSDTDLSQLSPVISISPGASINPESGVSQNFIEPVDYTITSENSAVENTWKVTVSLEEVSGLEHPSVTNFKLFPNPLSNKLKLELQLTESRKLSIHIFDQSGKQFHSEYFGKSQSLNRWLDLSKIRPGIYHLQILGNDEPVVVKKIIKI